MSSKHVHYTTTGTFRVIAGSNNSRLRQLRQIARATLGAGDLRAVVKLPAGADLNDWLAMNTIDFYNQLVVLFAPISKFCMPETCTEMTAGKKFQYYWQDTQIANSKPVMLPANEYMTRVINWVESYIRNNKYFPDDERTKYASDFDQVIKNIYKKMFRIYAHIYCHHSKDIEQAELLPSWNTSFRHFWTFIEEYNLVPKDQQAPLAFIIQLFEEKE